MLGSLIHRGPDGSGLAERDGCVLGLQRLAIMDVRASAEPFTSEDGSILCVVNGQIYNSAELRQELESQGHVFRTRVDTEVVVHLWEEHGVELIHRLNGMFAFAVWDSRRGRLMLGRDRAGEKPLFYRRDGEELLFASELRALLTHPRLVARLDPTALVRYLVHGYIPAPLSPVAGVHKLPAGHFLLAEKGTKRSEVEVVRYWDLADWFAEPGATDPRSSRELIQGLDKKLAVAVRRRSRSDVPFGVFLSGGIDSSTVLSYVCDAHGSGVPAFTIGHTDSSFDESDMAAETARHFGADLHRLVLDERDLEEGLHRIGEGMDEPLGDASTIPTHLLARLAREHVKVVLSGEGADELFGGYPTYLGHRLADPLAKLPGWIRRGLLAGIGRFTPATMGNVGFDYLLQRFASALDRERLERHHVWFGSIDPERLPGLLSPALLEHLGDAGLAAPFGNARPDRELPDSLAELLYADFTLYLQDDLLTKVDRATMLASLESRAPFLDHELAQYVAGIPSRWKVRGKTTKAILRRTVRERLPPAILERRKRGFNIPFSRWILHGLEGTLRERFSRERVEARGLFAYDGVRRFLDQHVARQADHRKPLFALLALDLWCDRTFGEAAAVPWAEARHPEDNPIRKIA